LNGGGKLPKEYEKAMEEMKEKYPDDSELQLKIHNLKNRQ
jgi:hypothetical protein